MRSAAGRLILISAGVRLIREQVRVRSLGAMPDALEVSLTIPLAALDWRAVARRRFRIAEQDGVCQRCRDVRGLSILIASASWCRAATGAPSTADVSDAEFRAQVETFATAHRRILMSWGTLPLDGSTQPHRFAALGVELGPDNEPARAADRTGAYLVEATPTKFWLIAYPWDATSFHVSDGEGRDGRASGTPPWLVLDETSIQHGLNHNHGKAYVWFGLRGDKLVALADEDVNVRREPESIRHEFATDGACVKRCPQLGTYKVLGYELLRVVGSACTITALPAF